MRGCAQRPREDLEAKKRTVTQSIQRQTGLLGKNLGRQFSHLEPIDVDLRGSYQHSRRFAVDVVLERLRKFGSGVVTVELVTEEGKEGLLLDLD